MVVPSKNVGFGCRRSLSHFGVLVSQTIICRNGLKYKAPEVFNADVWAQIVLVKHHSELVIAFIVA